MIFLTKTFKFKNIFYIKNNLLYYIKLFNDFIFVSLLIKEYIKIQNLYTIYFIKNFIYLLNILSIKYILYTIYTNNIFFINNNIIYNLELFFWKNKNFINYKKTIYNIEQKILLIKKISKTRKKGRVKKYKVIILIGNKSGWFGIGSSKNYYLQEAIIKARINAFKNIYKIPLFYSNTLKNNIYIKKNSKKIYLFSYNYKIKSPKHYVIRTLFNFIGITNNNSSKIIGIYNIYNILSLILNI